MKLTFHSTYLSIKDFPDIELPQFAILTGLNGTGKSHVLRAIKEGRIRNDLTQNFEHEIRLYDWTNFLPKDTGSYDGRTWINDRHQAFNSFQDQLRKYGNEVLDAARTAGVPSEHLIDAEYVTTLDVNKLRTIIGDSQRAESAAKSIVRAVGEVGNKIHGQITNENQRSGLHPVPKTPS